MSPRTPDPQTPPPSILCRQFLVDGLRPVPQILDIGCGHGELMTDLLQQGIASGGSRSISGSSRSAAKPGCRSDMAGLRELPFGDAEFDAIVSSVVIPYTDQQNIFAEWSRVLRPRGVINITCHGVRYGLHYALHWAGPASVWVPDAGQHGGLFGDGASASRFLGSTLCRAHRRIARYAEKAGLTLGETFVVDRFLGCSRFVGFRLSKPVAVPSVDSILTATLEQIAEVRRDGLCRAGATRARHIGSIEEPGSGCGCVGGVPADSENRVQGHPGGECRGGNAPLPAGGLARRETIGRLVCPSADNVSHAPSPTRGDCKASGVL